MSFLFPYFSPYRDSIVLISVLQLAVTSYLSFKVWKISKKDVEGPDLDLGAVKDCSAEIGVEDSYKAIIVNSGDGIAEITNLRSFPAHKDTPDESVAVENIPIAEFKPQFEGDVRYLHPGEEMEAIFKVDGDVYPEWVPLLEITERNIGREVLELNYGYEGGTEWEEETL